MHELGRIEAACTKSGPLREIRPKLIHAISVDPLGGIHALTRVFREKWVLRHPQKGDTTARNCQVSDVSLWTRPYVIIWRGVMRRDKAQRVPDPFTCSLWGTSDVVT